MKATALRGLSWGQLPLALAMVAVLAYDVYLRQTGHAEGLGAPAYVLEFVALLAGALGIKRPSEHAQGG